MKSHFFIFNLLQFYWVDAIWFSICDIELENTSGSLFLIIRYHAGSWDFDFLYYKLLKGLYKKWKDI